VSPTGRRHGEVRREVYQQYTPSVQITEAAEDNDGKNNTFANAQGDNSDNIDRKEREQIYVSIGE
jgi:hypothetical protein